MKQWKLDQLIPLLWGALPLMLVLHRRFAAITIICLALALIVRSIQKRHFPAFTRNELLIELSFYVLFAIYVIGFLRFSDHPRAEFELVQKLPLLALPLLWRLSGKLKSRIIPAIQWGLTSGIIIAGSIMLLNAVYRFYILQDPDVFVYNEFTSPLGISPIYLAFFTSLAILFPKAHIAPESSNALHYDRLNSFAVKVFLLTILALCSSKLFAIITIALLLVKYFNHFRLLKSTPKLLLLFILFPLLLIPVTKRVLELKNTGLEIVSQDQYRYDTPFNGLTLRLVQLRFGLEILRDESAYLIGIGPANTQDFLNAKYREHNMYTGNPKIGDKGYLAYNFHNQWMETWVAAGVIGLLGLVICSSFMLFFTYHQRVFASIVIVSISFLFTESVLERELGITMFVLIGLIVSTGVNPNNSQNHKEID